MKKSFREKYFGTPAFYKMVLMIAVPIMVQNGFTNFVNMLDNIMVGRVGTDEMSGVAVVNQLLFVYNLTIFGGLSGAGIFMSQYYGSKNETGIKSVHKIKLIIGISVLAVGLGVLYFLQEPLIKAFLNEGSETGSIEATLGFAKDYLNVMLIGLVPFTLSQCLSSSMRECEQTVAPMKAGVMAVLINLVLNYLLIYGKFGFPKLGVKGAAIATVISRFTECIFLIIWLAIHKKEYAFAGIRLHVKLTKEISGEIFRKGMPLLINELLWSGGMTVLTQCYSMSGLAAVGAVNIANTISNVFNIAFIALGDSVAIVVGNLMGAGKMKEAKETDTKMIVFSVLSCFIFSAMMIVAAPYFPEIYNTTDEVKELAKNFIIIIALAMPFFAFNHAGYFTIRSGGKTLITMLFDSCFVWIFNVTTAFILSRFTGISIVPLYAICQGLDIVKAIFTYIAVKSNIWMNNLVDNNN